MNEDKDGITIIGQTNFRNKVSFGIKEKDRMRHTYIIGKTGSGKSVLLENMIIDDIRDGRGVGFLDPHGESAETILKFI
ncbi:MAG: type IV secretory system conjugative DNA transfer family protein, partial [Candidatus Colwellbacteria bacterium]|nr:type IV secretory system conjugative DNA transfer family protein [Candidatus Colwellbacteria bacterium]